MDAVRQGFWIFGLASWGFGIGDRAIATYSDGIVSAVELAQVFTALLYLVLWGFLSPAWKSR